MRWVALITDDILEEFAVVAEIDDVVDKFKNRYGDHRVDRTTGSLPARDDDHARELLAKLSA